MYVARVQKRKRRVRCRILKIPREPLDIQTYTVSCRGVSSARGHAGKGSRDDATVKYERTVAEEETGHG